MKFASKKTPYSITAVIASVMASISPSASYAVDEKIFPGSICQPTSVQEAGQDMVYIGGSAVNHTRESQVGLKYVTLHCPLVRDNKDLPWRSSMYVRVNDNSTQAGVLCVASNYSPFGDDSVSVTQFTDRSFTGLKSLRFPPPSRQITGGAYNVFCYLPGNTLSGDYSAIHSIRLVEDQE